MKNLIKILPLIIIFLMISTSSYSQNKIRGYEYWFDNDFTGRVVTTSVPTSELIINNTISTSVLSAGIHTFNFRAWDDSAMYSSTLSQFFYKIPQATGGAVAHKITAYEYWFDNDYDNKTIVATAPQETFNLNALLNVGSLSSGIHTINIRFKDNENFWSSTMSQFFYKLDQTTNGLNLSNNKIINYRYWVDNKFSQAVNVSLPMAVEHLNLLNDLDLSRVSKGRHSIHFQFQDSLGM